MRFLIALAIFGLISVAKIQAKEFSIELPEDDFVDAAKSIVQNLPVQNLPEGSLNEKEQQIVFGIPDESFVGDIEKLLDEIQEILPKETKLHVSYALLKDEDHDDLLKNFDFVEYDDNLEDNIADDDDEYLEDEPSEDDDEYLEDAAYGDDYSEDDYSEDDYSEDDYSEDDNNDADELLEDDSSEKDEQVEGKEFEDDMEISEDSELCMPRICPRMYTPICALINETPRTMASPCEYSNMIRCSITANTRLGRSIPSFRVLGGGTCDEIMDKTINSRTKRVALE